MKIAVLADIHSNFAALDAVADHIERWQPDRVIVGGDVINRGPRPRECLDFVLDRVRTQGWQCVLGNHEEYVITHAAPETPISGPRFELHRSSFWTYQQLNCDVSAIRVWSFQASVKLNGSEARFAHASMLGTRRGIHVETPDALLRQQIAPPTDLFVVGHTHKPLIRSIDETLVVNVGSVGLPFDGDPRACYAQLTWRGDHHWQAEIVRVEYDRARADRDFEDTGFITQVGSVALLIRDELQRAQSNLFEWANMYETAVLQGSVTLDETVRRYLSELDGRRP